MLTSTGIPISTITLIEVSIRIRLPAGREDRGNGSITLNTARESHTKTRAHGINMVNQGRVPRTGKISGDSHRIQGIDKVLARGMLLVEMLPVVIGHQLQTEVEETWRQAVTHLVVVVGAIQCSPGSQTPLMVWIEAEKTLKCRVIVEAPVARACRRHPVAAEVAPVAAEEDTPAVVEVAHVAAEAVAVGAVAGDNL
jgi:hypothetical protein